MRQWRGAAWRRDRFFLATVGGALMLNAAAWLVLLGNVRPSGDLIPIHYTIYFGIDRLGTWRELFFVPLSGSLVLIINSTLAGLWYQRERFLSLAFTMTALLVALLTAIGTLFLLALNRP